MVVAISTLKPASASALALPLASCLLPTTQCWLVQGGRSSSMQQLENCMFSLRVHCDEQTYLVSSDRPFVVVLGKLPYMSAMRRREGGGDT